MNDISPISLVFSNIPKETLEKLKSQFAASIQSVNNTWRTPIFTMEDEMPELIIWPNDTLKLKSLDLQSLSLARSLSEDMFKVMYKHKGVGLSAIQIGIPYRLVVMDCSDGSFNLLNNIEPKPLVLINPIIKELIGNPVEMSEGCLSFPGVFEKIKRYPEVIVVATDLDGNLNTYQMAGLEAQCIVHEVEHLDGITFDKGWGRVKRNIVKRKINKALK